MNKKDLEKKLKLNKPQKGPVKVTVADDSVVSFFKPLIKELYHVFRKTYLFSSDQGKLAHDLEDEPHLRAAQIQHKILVLKEAFGVTATEKEINLPYKDFLPWLNENRTVHNPKYLCPPLLGILDIADENDEAWHLNYFFGVKGQLDYYTGWLLGKTSPEALEIKKNLAEEIKNYQELVYGVDPKKHFIIQTLEGDTILCNNRHEVCCWVLARASNYRPELKKKENW